MTATRFALLLAATLLAALALAAMVLTEPRPAPQEERPVAAFPLLAEAPGEAAEIVVTGPEGSYRVKRSAAAGLWLLPDKGGYPADSRAVGRLLTGLAGLTLHEAKTARAENLDLLGLADPESGPESGPGSGPRVQVFDRSGAPLLDAVIGERRENLGRVGVTATYLRYADADQAWLALGDPVIPSSALAMVDQGLVSLPASLIAEVRVTPPEGGEPLEVRRPDRGSNELELQPPPSPGATVDRFALNALAGSLQQLLFDEVRPAEELALEEAWTAAFTSFDGIRIVLRFLQEEDALWATLSAAAVPPPGGETQEPRADAAAFAAELDARTAGWAFRLDPFLYQRLALTRRAAVRAAGD